MKILTKNLTSKQDGQAVVEYIILFALVGYFGLQLLGLITKQLGQTTGRLSISLSKSLSAGVCESKCFYKGYVNQGKP